MAKKRHLKNAPIVEAIIDFRAITGASFDVTRLSSLEETLQADYPKVEQRRQYARQLEFGGMQVQQTVEDRGVDGYFFKSADDTNVAQFRRGGFTFNRLRPYTEWNSVLAEAKRLWELYRAEASPELVSRLAVRYINQIGIPLPINDLSEYLKAPPAIPETLPQTMTQFMTRVVVCDVATDIHANIIQALQSAEKSDEVTIILDIDVYRQLDSGFEESEIWPTFEQLRDLKNRIFFDSITEETARLFE